MLTALPRAGKQPADELAHARRITRIFVTRHHRATAYTPCIYGKCCCKVSCISIWDTKECSFLPEVREFIKDTRPETNTTRGGRKAHRPTPKTRTIHTTVLPDR
jgi:hypothetical protein